MIPRKARWGNAALALYTLGYWGYLGTVAIVLWPRYSVLEWLNFMFVHAMVATFWPVAIYLWHVGYFS